MHAFIALPANVVFLKKQYTNLQHVNNRRTSSRDIYFWFISQWRANRQRTNPIKGCIDRKVRPTDRVVVKIVKSALQIVLVGGRIPNKIAAILVIYIEK